MLTAMLAVASRNATAESCSAHAGPRAFVTGVLGNGSCGYCTTSGALVPCTAGLVPGTLEYPGHTNRSGCLGRWCLSCGGEIDPPPGAEIFVSGHCGFFDDAPGGPAAVLDLRGPLVNVSLVVAAAGARVNGSLTLAGTVSVAGGALHIQASPPPGCGLRLTNTPGHTTINASIASPLFVAQSDCGVSVTPAHWATGVTGAVAVGLVRPGPEQTGPFFSMAVANVAGEMSTTDPGNTAVMLDRSHTHRVSFSPQWAHIVNLSTYLSVFGAEYEIEYFHDGARVIPKPAWVGKLAAANRFMAPIALVFLLVLGRSAALAPAKVHAD